MPHLLRRRTSDSTDAEVTLGLMPTSPPLSLAIPPPPPLDPDVPDSDPVSSSTYPDPDVDRTNTLALLLPHPSLFHPPVLALLRQHYEGYASIAHWAPIRGFGRVIVVFDSVEGAASAKKEGDRLWLDVDVTSPGGTGTRTGTGGIAATALALGEDPDGPVAQERRAGEVAGEVEASSRSYFSPRKRRKSASPAGGLLLRLHPLPYTNLAPDPSTTHLKPPTLERNFLVSPPGSPPEGWEPITEEAPNSSTLADDLQRALEALQLNGRGKGGKEVILEEGGVRVEVEDCTMLTEGPGGDGDGDGDAGMRSERWEIEETVVGAGDEAFRLPSQDFGFAPTPGLGGGAAGLDFGALGGGLGSGVKLRIAPTARPPI